MDMPGDHTATALEKARRTLGLTRADLYTRYIGVTGVASRDDVAAYFHGAGTVLEPREHDKLVVAINESFLERALPDRLPFKEP